ncbi:MAG: septal ring lytic transglycosylase RlpA family protein [Verrucomicrobiota bacterium]
MAALSAAILIVTGCATSSQGPVEGVLTASWYGEPFHGRRTASGEVYNMYALSAAHKTAPLGTILSVTSLENGRNVRVTITDRGPFIRGRDLDLSYGAAKKLDMVDDGVIQVRAKKVGYDSRYAKYIKDGGAIQKAEGSSSSNNALNNYYTAQVGAFTQKNNADALAKKLETVADQVSVSKVRVNGKDFFRVYVGKYKTRVEADDVVTYLAARGYDAKVNKLSF